MTVPYHAINFPQLPQDDEEFYKVKRELEEKTCMYMGYLIIGEHKPRLNGYYVLKLKQDFPDIHKAKRAIKKDLGILEETTLKDREELSPEQIELLCSPEPIRFITRKMVSAEDVDKVCGVKEVI